MGSEVKELEESLKNLEKRLKLIEDFITKYRKPLLLLPLPDHLRKTMIVLCNLHYVTADDVAEQTKRARAVESNYLNQLYRSGRFKIEKERIGQKVYFILEENEIEI